MRGRGPTLCAAKATLRRRVLLADGELCMPHGRLWAKALLLTFLHTRCSVVFLALAQDMINNPWETQSDSFYFVDDVMVMHNKAKYAYTPAEY